MFLELKFFLFESYNCNIYFEILRFFQLLSKFTNIVVKETNLIDEIHYINHILGNFRTLLKKEDG